MLDKAITKGHRMVILLSQVDEGEALGQNPVALRHGGLSKRDNSQHRGNFEPERFEMCAILIKDMVILCYTFSIRQSVRLFVERGPRSL